MIVKLRSAAEKREILVKDLFKIEFTDVPESLFDPRKLTSYQPSSKSGILRGAVIYGSNTTIYYCAID